MWKKLISMILIIGFISLFTLTSAKAGSKQRYMFYGAGIGLVAAALGLMAHRVYTQPPQVVYYPPPEPRYFSPLPPPEYVSGHWEITREWVPGTWERVWVPGHYDRWLQAIMRTTKLLGITLRKRFGSKGITEIVKN